MGLRGCDGGAEGVSCARQAEAGTKIELRTEAGLCFKVNRLPVSDRAQSLELLPKVCLSEPERKSACCCFEAATFALEARRYDEVKRLSLVELLRALWGKGLPKSSTDELGVPCFPILS